MGAGLKVVIPKSYCNHLESSYPSCPARFIMSEFLGKPRPCSGPSRIVKPTILGTVAALGTGFSLAGVGRCNLAGCRHVLFALPSTGCVSGRQEDNERLMFLKILI